MKLSKNQNFSIPVITDVSEYYSSSIEYYAEFIEPSVSYKLVCNSKYINYLFETNKVSFITNIEGSNPAFRITHVMDSSEGYVEIPKTYLKGNINVTFLIIAKENFILEDKEIIFNGKYSVDKNQIIGYVPSYIFKIALDAQIGELISFNESEKDVIEYNYSDSSIDIYLPKNTFNFLKMEQHNKSIENTIFNLYVFPALIAYLNKMKYEEDDSLLFNTFCEILISGGIDINDDNFVNKIPMHAANILNNTFIKIPNEIDKLKGSND